MRKIKDITSFAGIIFFGITFPFWIVLLTVIGVIPMFFSWLGGLFNAKILNESHY